MTVNTTRTKLLELNYQLKMLELNSRLIPTLNNLIFQCHPRIKHTATDEKTTFSLEWKDL